MSGGAERKTAAMALAALGVVFGDIGTSPLYTYDAALGALGGAGSGHAAGVASLIVWSLLFLVTFKYVGLVMRADYHGEGGVFALLSLLKQKMPVRTGLRQPAYVVMLLFGATLMFGDGTITPAISVLSAIEGLEAVDPGLKPAVLPITVGLLAALFAVQRFGTGRLGKVFGWVMLLWFVTIGMTGLSWVIRAPEVLAAFNPLLALETLRTAGWSVFLLMGGVVLAVTGVEALYADMGHFSRRAISLAWHFVALPALVLNYLGQAALEMRRPLDFEGGTPFFHLVPDGWPTIALVVLATLATIIASQALISGVFSLTAQARDLRFLPRLKIIHTSRHERGQVYVPFANWALAAMCIFLVVVFRSSANLAAAYGLAVVGSMIITTISMGLVTHKCWGWPRWRSVGLVVALLGFESTFLVSSLAKLGQGAYFPIVIAAGLMVVMMTWQRGRAIIAERVRAAGCPIEELGTRLDGQPTLPGQLVLITMQEAPWHAVARVNEMCRQGFAMREQIVFLSLVNVMASEVNIRQSIRTTRHGERVWHVVSGHGYMQEPHAELILSRASELTGGEIRMPETDTFYVLPRELLIEYVGSHFPRWRRILFGVLGRNQSYAPDYLHIPHSQLVEFTWMMKA